MVFRRPQRTPATVMQAAQWDHRLTNADLAARLIAWCRQHDIRDEHGALRRPTSEMVSAWANRRVRPVTEYVHALADVLGLPAETLRADFHDRPRITVREGTATPADRTPTTIRPAADLTGSVRSTPIRSGQTTTATSVTLKEGKQRGGVDAVHPPTPEGVSATDRRDTIRAGAAAMAAMMAGAATPLLNSEATRLAQVVGRSNVSTAMLEQLDTAIDHFSRQYGHAPAAQLLPQLEGATAFLRQLLEGPQSLRRRAHLLRAAARLSGISAELNFDLGREAESDLYLTNARSIAEEIGDNELLGWVYAFQAANALYEKEFVRAVHLARTGQQVAVGPARAQLLTAEARAAARIGDRDTATHAAERAETIAEPSDNGTMFTFSRVAALQHVSYCWLWLGEPDRATEAAREAIRPFEQGSARNEWPRNATYARIALATAHAQQGEPEQACGLAKDVLVSEQDQVHPFLIRTHELLVTLRPYGEVPAVRELRELVRAGS